MTPSPPPIGLLAGWGRFPIVIAQALKKAGHPVICHGLRDHADPILRVICDEWNEAGLAQLQSPISFFAAHGVQQAVMAGKVHKVRLFDSWVWWKNLPDWRAAWVFFPHFVTGRRDRKDDTLLLAIVDAFAQDGIAFRPATDFCPELLVKTGPLTHRGLTTTEEQDARFGWQLAKEMGRLDIGQTVIVRGQATICVEAIEGTDECIRRAGTLCQQGGFTVVKVAKPQQDMRFDVPTIGLGTLKILHESGGSALVIEADKTILIDEREVLAFANAHGIAIVAQEAAAAEQRAAA